MNSKIDFSTALSPDAFIEPTDAFRLALVHGGVKQGHCLWDIDTEEVTRLGRYEESKGRTHVEDTLEQLALPYDVIETTAETDPAYGNSDLTLSTYFVAHNDDWLQTFESDLQQGVDCRTLGAFETIPECCTAVYCEDYGTTDQYLEELHDYVSTHNPTDNELTVLSVMPELSHYPCSPDCDDSYAIGTKALTFFEEHYDVAHDYYQSLTAERLKKLH